MTDQPAPPLGEKTHKKGPEMAPSRPVTTLCASFCETCFRTVIEVREAEPEADLATRLRRKLEGRSQLAYPVDRADIERLLCILEERATPEGGE